MNGLRRNDVESWNRGLSSLKKYLYLIEKRRKQCKSFNFTEL
ncbi:MAG: hypothetical protein JWQ40_1320 [Segetibacter sp.]|nr:hypothetical protein [Segetibacter sp.]